MKPTNLEAAAPVMLKALKAIVKAERDFWKDTGLKRSEMDDPFNEVVMTQARAAIALAKVNKDQSYCGECNRPAANCDCGEFE